MFTLSAFIAVRMLEALQTAYHKYHTKKSPLMTLDDNHSILTRIETFRMVLTQASEVDRSEVLGFPLQNRRKRIAQLLKYHIQFSKIQFETAYQKIVDLMKKTDTEVAIIHYLSLTKLDEVGSCEDLVRRSISHDAQVIPNDVILKQRLSNLYYRTLSLNEL